MLYKICESKKSKYLTSSQIIKLRKTSVYAYIKYLHTILKSRNILIRKLREKLKILVCLF